MLTLLLKPLYHQNNNEYSDGLEALDVVFV